MSVERFMKGKKQKSPGGSTPAEVQHVKDFYKRLVKRPNVRELLERLAKK